jgi:hypothetical protein
VPVIISRESHVLTTKPRISNDREQHAVYREIDKLDTNFKDYGIRLNLHQLREETTKEAKSTRYSIYTRKTKNRDRYEI